jgi:hypothetical protein
MSGRKQEHVENEGRRREEEEVHVATCHIHLRGIALHYSQASRVKKGSGH